MKNGRTILLVEDDQVDVIMIRRAFDEMQISNPVRFVGNGEEALGYLNDNELPGVIILDLNMPLMNGLELLRIIKSDADYRLIPVVVFTSSHGADDIKNSFLLGASGYFLKPVEYKMLLQTLQTIHQYWSCSLTRDALLNG